MSVFRVDLMAHQTNTGQTMLNTLYYRDAVPDPFNFIPDDIIALADMVKEQVWCSIPPVPPANYGLRQVMDFRYELDSIQVRALNSLLELGDSGSYSLTVNENGSHSNADCLPTSQHVTLSARWDYTLGIASNLPKKGRLYFSPCPETEVNENGELSPTWEAKWGQVAVRLGENLERILPTPQLFFPVRIKRLSVPSIGTWNGVRDINSWAVSHYTGNLRSRIGR